MALIEIDGLPSYIAWWIFPWRTVSHNQMVTHEFMGGIRSNQGSEPRFHDFSTMILQVPTGSVSPVHDQATW